MRAFFNSWIVRAVALFFTASVAASFAAAQDRVPFRQEELDQMLAPIALYPDPLLSQILMASTYPLEVVQASRWSRANPGLKGQDAVRAVEGMDWDPSVKSLAAFPQVLAMMDEKIDWTEKLGEAFLAQQADVMDSVQALRRRADAAGNLLSSDQMRVSRQGETIYIAPPAPEVVYVPYYNPTVVYGPWWYPAYPPVYWAPPAYVVPAYRPGFFWSPGISISVGFFFGHADWHHRRVNVVHNQVTNVTVNRTTIINNPPARSQVAWQHDPAHRRGVPFKNEAARQRYEQVRASAPAAHSAPSRSAATRQRNVDERRNATPEHRGNGRVERRDADAPRAASPSPSPNVRPRNAEQQKQAAPEQREKRRVERHDNDKQAPRAAPNAQGNRAPDRSDNERARPRPEPRAPQADNRSRPPQAAPQRQERAESPRPQARAMEQPRQAPAQPAPRAENRGNDNGHAVQRAPANHSRPAQARGNEQRGERSGKGRDG